MHQKNFFQKVKKARWVSVRSHKPRHIVGTCSSASAGEYPSCAVKEGLWRPKATVLCHIGLAILFLMPSVACDHRVSRSSLHHCWARSRNGEEMTGTV